MKKYTKRILAFVLAAAMVITGVPMSAKEAKAESETITYDLLTASTGVVTSTVLNNGTPQTYGDTVTGMDNALNKVGGYYVITTSYQGEGWKINNELTTAPLSTYAPLASDGSSIYEKAAMSGTQVKGMHIQCWTSGTKRAIAANKGAALAFDFEVPEAGTYALNVTNYNHPSAAVAIESVSVNGTEVATQIAGSDTTRETSAYQDFPAGEVYLNAGTNTIVFKSVNTRNGFMLKGFNISPIKYEAASFNLEDGASFIVGDTFALETKATLNTGAEIIDGLSVEYATSNAEAATIVDGALVCVGSGKANISATVSYNGEVKETITRAIEVKVEGQFSVDFTETDVTTLINDGTGGDKNPDKSRYYQTAESKSKEGASTVWSMNAEKTDVVMMATGFDENNKAINGGARMYLTDGVPTHMQVMSGARYLVYDFEAPAAGLYNLDVDLKTPGEKYGHCSFFVNGVFMGTIDCYPGNPENQKLLSVELVEGTNELSIIAVGASSGTEDYAAIVSVNFVPTDAENARKVTSLTATIDVDTYDMAVEQTGMVTVEAEADGGVILRPDYTFSVKDGKVAYIHRTGKVTPKGAGETSIVVTMNNATYEIPITVNDTRPRYTVAWLNDDGTEIATSELLEGAAIAYKGDAPVKEADAQYTYEFAGWVDAEGNPLAEDAVMGTEAVTYTATYTATVNKYIVSFVVDGEVVSSEEYEYGAMPVAPEVADKEDADKVYTFVGWDAEVSAVTGEATYTAVFEEVIQNYTITFVDEDGTVLSEITVAPGDVPVYTGETPVKAGTAQYSYKFAGWTPEVVAAAGNEIYTATYEETVNEYTITWVVDGVESTTTVAYGETPVFEGSTDKEADAQYTYTFAGWSPEVVAVTGDATYEATYEETVNEYTITWVVDGVESTTTVAYGETPVFEGSTDKEADAEYVYTFAGWTPEVVAVTGDATYEATYEKTVNEYTVTWMNFDGTVIATETYKYGETPEYKGETPVYNSYTFTGWSPAIAAVEGDATYTAQFEMSGKSIEWFDEDGDGVAETGYYYVDGAVKKGAGLVEVDGYLYWVLSTGKIALGTTRTIRANQTNGLIEAGTYYFLSNGILETAEVRLSGEIRWSEENGKQVGYYYVMNEVRKDVGLVEVWNEEAEETTWYYVLFSGKVKRNYVADGKRVNQTVKTNRLNKYTGPEGLYSFYEDGVMYDPYATETGIVKYDETGKPWYYVDGHIRKDAGLVYVTRGDMAGNYIFVTFSGTLKKGTQSIKEKTCNGHTEFIGTQRFDSTTGAMIIK